MNLPMNMQMNMNYMPSQFQQNDIAMANYTHNLNMLSANMNPYGNIPPPPPQLPMGEYPSTGIQPNMQGLDPNQQKPGNLDGMVKKEEN